VQGLMAEHLTGSAADEGVDHINVSVVWELIALLGEALNLLPKVSLALCLQLRRS
jgi:hypothetical protein